MKKLGMLVLITMFLLTTTTGFASMTYSYPNKVKYEDYALKLKEIGVFKGTSTGFELDREPTRVEAAVMFVRLLGAEREALGKKYRHPFTDVPSWADDYVGYLYHERLTKGTSETTFGSANNIQAKSYMTFILRALGYNDLEGDFSWGEALEFAKGKGIIDEEDFNELSTKTFLRDHVAKISYKALKTAIKDGGKTLIQKLVDENLIDRGKAEGIGLMAESSSQDKADYPQIDLSNDVIIKVNANPGKGFNYPFYLYIPKGIERSSIRYMLVETNNTGRVSDDFNVHDEDAKELIERGIPNTIAKELVIPALVPVFPRTETEWRTYTHALDRDTLILKGNSMERIDLQLINMIDYALETLSSNGIEMDKKVFMSGFSASGNFANRFTAIHPDRIKAVVTGGVNCMPILPVEEWEGNKLTYPVGIGDLEEITGKEFNLEEYKKVAQYIYMGYLDENDTLIYRDAYDEPEKQLTLKILGGDMHDRWNKSIEIIRQTGANPQFVMYNNTKHEIKSEMIDDIIEFLKSNTGEDIVHIKPHQYIFVKREPEIKSVTIKRVITKDAEGLDEWHASMLGDHSVLLDIGMKIPTPERGEGTEEAKRQRAYLKLFAGKIGKLYLEDVNGTRYECRISGTAGNAFNKDYIYLIMDIPQLPELPPGRYKIIEENPTPGYTLTIDADLVIE